MSDTTKNEQLSLDNQICFSLYSAANAMVRAYRPLLEKLDLTYPQYLAMLVLWQNDGISVKTLGEKLHLDSGTLTPLLKRLEGKGLVIRARSTEDERMRVLNLTDKGHALKTPAQVVPDMMKCKIKGVDMDLVAFKQACDQLYQQLAE
ncbi:MarR family winged helix-turn-helix transcriptional regulator [Shewanella surugensis]|uniref:MarR family transcriptional regulator n=1 Tax=Shewanella surugensis TaxID=212020 RepID=A0ABT0LI84_9GAMM|nr:MarR family transcriptional regulator [Shewanella surugensis]MCL1127426.1 MarR family transcriptional regulator [Shewanella surugensis]